MFDVVVDKNSLDLPIGFKMDMEFKHQFVGSKVQGSYAIPWQLPYTLKNERIFKHATSIKLKDGSRSFPALIYKRGKLVHTGVIIINEAERDDVLQQGGYDVDFIVDGYSVDLLDKKLSDLNYGPVISMGADEDDVIDYMKTECGKTWPAAAVSFPMVKNPNFYGESNPSYSGYVNKYDIANQEFYKNAAHENRTCVVPYPYLGTILQAIFSGFNIVGSFFSIPVNRKIHIHSNYANDYKRRIYHVRAAQAAPWSFPDPVDHAKVNTLTDDSTGQNQDINGIYDSANSTYEVQTTGRHNVKGQTTITSTDLGPEGKRVTILVYKDGQIIGTTQVFGFFTTPEVIDFDGTKVMDGTDIGDDIELRIIFEKFDGLIWVDSTCDVEDTWWEFENVGESDRNIFSTELDISKCVPDIKAGEFLNEWRKMGLVFTMNYNSREVSIDYIDSTWKTVSKNMTKKTGSKKRVIMPEETGFTFSFEMNVAELVKGNEEISDLPDLSAFTTLGTVDTLSELPDISLVNALYLVKNINSYYVTIVNGSDEIEWVFLTYNHYPLVMGNGDDEVTVKFSPLLVREDTVDGYNLLIPYIEETGSSGHFTVGLNKPAFKFSYFQGLRDCATGEDYPFATPYQMDFNGNVLDDSKLIFSTDSDTFFFVNCYRWYLNFISALRYKVFQQLEESDLSGLNFLQPIDIDFNRFVYLSISTSYTQRGIDIAECDFLKID